MKISASDCSDFQRMPAEAETLPKVSIITAVYNQASTIASAIASVANQTSNDIEHIIVDGMSNDGTDRVVDINQDKISSFIREPDDGLYDALNKGIAASSGDIIGFVHADDMLDSLGIIKRIQEEFVSGGYDAVYGDLLYVDSDHPEQVVRYWTPGEFERKKFRDGWMPPHPTVFFKKSAYLNHGVFRTDFGSGSDYECLIRLMYKTDLKIGYINQVVTRMRTGGQSNATLLNRLKANRTDRRAWLENGLAPPFGLRLRKPLSKLSQYFKRPR